MRYDPLITERLAREIESRWSGCGVRSLGMDRERSAASLRFADDTVLAAFLAPDAGYVVPLAADPLEGDRVRVTRFGRMSLSRVEPLADERSLAIWLTEDDGTVAAGVGLELHTNRWNVVVLSPPDGNSGDREWRVRYALWTREIAGRRVGPGEPWSPPASERRAIEDAPSRAEWDDWVASLAESGEAEAGGAIERGELLRTWAWTSALNVEWLLGRDEGVYERYLELHELGSGGGPDGPVWLLRRRGTIQPYPHSLGQADASSAESLFAAVSRALEHAVGADTLPGEEESGGSAETERLRDRLESARARAAKRVAALRRQLETAGSPDVVRELGQILLARKDAVEKGAVSVVLEAFDGSEREIELDPSLDVVANAERFFEEARRRERAREKLPSEIAGAETRVRAFDDALDRLDRAGPDDGLWGLVGGRAPRSRQTAPKGGEPDRLPYTRLVSSGGLEIRVGRGPRDNDDLTFRHSAPDDIWMHAAQTPGAHVILRWGRRDENPPRRDLLEAAVAAAVHSGARHSGAVSVSWTRRKYVRKPRKAPPGTVLPDRVRTLLVEPDEELVRTLREQADDG
ncbi:MAG: NFACT RNA binding domain-containing protein [Gemmatimonadota bacterium]|nr:NFACT RNA binding domain-containing protein [Gemmatimonadota bacterium]